MDILIVKLDLASDNPVIQHELELLNFDYLVAAPRSLLCDILRLIGAPNINPVPK